MSLILLSTLAMWWVAHVILVSAQGPNPSFFFFGGTFIRFGGLLGQGLGLGLGRGLDNFIFDSGAREYLSKVEEARGKLHSTNQSGNARVPC